VNAYPAEAKPELRLIGPTSNAPPGRARRLPLLSSRPTDTCPPFCPAATRDADCPALSQN
jgi:hypothetical protein